MSFQNLRAWQESVDLAVLIYMVSDHFPPRERHGLTAVMRKTAASLATSIAEGRGRFGYARGSAGELDEQIEVAMHLGFLTRESAATLAVRAAKIGKRLDRLLSHRQSGSVEHAIPRLDSPWPFAAGRH